MKISKFNCSKNFQVVVLVGVEKVLSKVIKFAKLTISIAQVIQQYDYDCNVFYAIFQLDFYALNEVRHLHYLIHIRITRWINFNFFFSL
jgi:hypothetical protein